jgi:hypothetical protein
LESRAERRPRTPSGETERLTGWLAHALPPTAPSLRPHCALAALQVPPGK